MGSLGELQLRGQLALYQQQGPVAAVTVEVVATAPAGSCSTSWANFWGKKRGEISSDLCTMLRQEERKVISFALLKFRERKMTPSEKALAQCLTSSISSFLIFLRLVYKHQVETTICLARSHQSDELDESLIKEFTLNVPKKNGVRYVYQAYDAPWLKN